MFWIKLNFNVIYLSMSRTSTKCQAFNDYLE